MRASTIRKVADQLLVDIKFTEYMERLKEEYLEQIARPTQMKSKKKKR